MQNKFIDRRKDGSTTVTFSGTQTFMWQFENRLLSLSLSLMHEIDKRCQEEKERLQYKRYWKYDPVNKVWWTHCDQRYDPLRNETVYGERMLILQLTDMQPDENGGVNPLASVHWNGYYPGYTFDKAVQEFMDYKKRYPNPFLNVNAADLDKSTLSRWPAPDVGGFFNG